MLDIIRNSLDMTSNLQETSIDAILASMLVATFCGMLIYCIYRFFYRGVVYSENFNILIVLTCLVTAFIIKTISANLVLSLGMVGALSIVRFRAAIKDPLDVGFLFWAIAAGLTSGAQLYGIALIGTVFTAIVYTSMTFWKKDKRSYLLIVRYEEAAEEAIKSELAQIKYRLKNKTKTPEITEITIDIKIKGNNASIVDKFNGIQSVKNCVLLEYSGDYAN